MEAESQVKSIITCDLEGRIETFSKGASEVFGYQPEEVIGKKRVSLFSPGLTVLEHVPHWLSQAVKNGAHETKTVFVRKDGTRFPAEIKITPTFKSGRQIGYCGITRTLPQEMLNVAQPKISPATRIFAGIVITRAPFLTASLIPVGMAAAYAKATGADWSWAHFFAAFFGAGALQAAANTFNDYFDWKSGTDAGNNDYFLPFSGGSRAIELGLISEAGLWKLSWALMIFAALCGGWIALEQGGVILAYGLAGALGGYFYTAPPLRLVARRGLGELLIGLLFGPLMTGGAYTALTGQFSLQALLFGVPVGLLTTAILWINEFPDSESDARTGKNHLVVTLGKKSARWGYLALLLGAFVFTTAWGLSGFLPRGVLLSLLSAPFAVIAIRTLFRDYNSRALVLGNKNTIMLQAVFGLLSIIGLLVL
ncbi:MAG: UbiA family prenyltransferase [Bdellovibrionales bacterium]|nr:UbiA family prenyltransferase [Bdellovibrionales bacterium]